jgi:hypothetical protein
MNMQLKITIDFLAMETQHLYYNDRI